MPNPGNRRSGGVRRRLKRAKTESAQNSQIISDALAALKGAGINAYDPTDLLPAIRQLIQIAQGTISDDAPPARESALALPGADEDILPTEEDDPLLEGLALGDTPGEPAKDREGAMFDLDAPEMGLGVTEGHGSSGELSAIDLRAFQEGFEDKLKKMTADADRAGMRYDEARGVWVDRAGKPTHKIAMGGGLAARVNGGMEKESPGKIRRTKDLTPPDEQARILERVLGREIHRAQPGAPNPNAGKK